MARMQDVLIVGAGPAGATAAVFLGRRGAKVTLLDRVDPREGPARSTWIGGAAGGVLEAAGIDPAFLTEHPIRSVHFVSPDLEKETTVSLTPGAACFVECRQLISTLVNAAEQAGAAVRFDYPVAELRADERCVSVCTSDGGQIEARLAILAPGRQSEARELLTRAGLVFGERAHRAHVGIRVEEATRTAAAGRDEVFLMLGLEYQGFGSWWRCGSRMVASVGVQAGAGQAVAALRQLATDLVEAGRAPAELVEAAAHAPAAASPAGEALDAHSHVLKRALVVGEAGGFVAAASHEGLYPAIWSAKLAAEVIVEALGSPEPQGRLSEFENLWRTTIAGHLQPLDSDMRFLHPLVVTNHTIASRVALSIFTGRKD